MVKLYEFPGNVTMAADWKFLFAGKWAYREGVIRSEGRVVVQQARHILRSVSGLNRFHLILCDNLALTLAIGKGRGKSMAVQATCRERGRNQSVCREGISRKRPGIDTCRRDNVGGKRNPIHTVRCE